jgi:DNA repair exonuclease SbcCD ATPase subunit
MNELFKRVKGYFICGLICFVIGGGVSFAGLHFYTQNRLDHYEKLVDDARAANEQLERNLQTAIDRNRELESTIQSITESITRINNSSGKITIIVTELKRINSELRKIIDKYE